MSTEMTMTLHADVSVPPSERRLRTGRGNAVRIASIVVDRANGILTLRGRGLFDNAAKTQVSLNGCLLPVLHVDVKGEEVVVALPALAPRDAFIIVQSGCRVATATAVLDWPAGSAATKAP